MSVVRFLAIIKRRFPAPTKGAFGLLAATIQLGIVGTIGVVGLTQRSFWNFSMGMWYQLGLLIVAIVSAAYSTTLRNLIDWLRRKTDNDEQVPVKVAQEVEPQPALIAFVSDGKGTSHETAIQHHLGQLHVASQALRHVVLVASKDSTKKANDYISAHEAEHAKLGLRVELFAWPDETKGNNVNFNDLANVFDATEAAIARLRAANSWLEPHQIALDITGGNAVVSGGAVLAGTGQKVTIEYLFTPPPDYDPMKAKFYRVIMEDRDAAPETQPAAGAAGLESSTPALAS